MGVKMFLPTELERTSVNSMKRDSKLLICWNALQPHCFRILFMPLRFFDVGKNLNVIHMRTFWYKISLTAKEEWEKLCYRHEKLSRSRLGEGHIGNKWKEKRGALQSLPKDWGNRYITRCNITIPSFHEIRLLIFFYFTIERIQTFCCFLSRNLRFVYLTSAETYCLSLDWV